MKQKRSTSAILAILLFAGISLLFFIVVSFQIGHDVKSQCESSQSEYNGDCIDALITVLNYESKSFRARNSAIWALGQLGDKRTLPVLQKYYTGIIPSKEPLDKAISQYELKKAINLTSGGFNITAFIWRNN